MVTVDSLQTAAEHPSVTWVRRIYLWLIFGVIGGMLLHNVLLSAKATVA